MASFYHEMLASGWQKRDLGPGPATELEKLNPAQKVLGLTDFANGEGHMVER